MEEEGWSCPSLRVTEGSVPVVPGSVANSQQYEGTGDGSEEAKTPGGEALFWCSRDKLSLDALLSTAHSQYFEIQQSHHYWKPSVAHSPGGGYLINANDSQEPMSKGESREEIEAGVSPRQSRFHDDTEHADTAHC